MGHLQAMVSIAGLTEEVVAELCGRAKQAAPGEGEVCQIAKPVCNLSAAGCHGATPRENDHDC